MKVREIDISEKARFNHFIASFPTGDLMQSCEWGEVKARAGGWRPVRLVGEDGRGEVVAAASLLFRSISPTARTIAYAPRGPVLDTADPTLVSAFADGMRQVALSRRAVLLKIDPPVPIEDEISVRNIESAGFRRVVDLTGFGGTQPRCVMQLDLDPSLDDLLASFKPKWRYNIRLAEKKGVVIKTDCTRDDLRAFYGLLLVTARRDGFLVRGYSYFETMWDVLVPPGYAKLFLAVYEEKPIAGAFDFLVGDRAMYVYGASANEHRNLMPNHLMQWEMIKWAKSLGCKWYDFRGVSPRRGAGEIEDRLQGLNRFKEGFSPRYVEYIGEYDMILSPAWYWLWVHAKPTVVKLLRRRPRRSEGEG